MSDEGKVDHETELKLIRAFRENYEAAQEEEDMIQLRKKVDDYRKNLKECGVKDWELKNLDTSLGHNIF